MTEVVTRELIQSIIDSHDADPNKHRNSLSGRIVEELQRITRITSELAKIAREETAESERHSHTLNSLGLRRAAIRKECRHPKVTRHGDPAGGNAGFTSCEVCGAEV